MRPTAQHGRFPPGAAGPLPTLESKRRTPRPNPDARWLMLQLAVVFFVIALVAGALGFTGVAVGAAQVAQLLFVVFLLLALGSFVLDALRRRRSRKVSR